MPRTRDCGFTPAVGPSCEGTMSLLDDSIEIFDNDDNGNPKPKTFEAWKCQECEGYQLVEICLEE